jgi:hypothetical protein
VVEENIDETTGERKRVAAESAERRAPISAEFGQTEPSASRKTQSSRTPKKNAASIAEIKKTVRQGD